MNYDDLDYYQSLGFKSGLEIHQQLNTQKKLFCHCPVGYQKVEPDARIVRHMRPTLSEMGTYDGTALMEFKTHKEVVYLLYRDYVCTYEMDDTPPFPINQQALDYAIEIALMLNCQLVDEVHITRKQYLDGSIPTGFQRTAIIGVDGWVPYKGRKIKIQQLALEEDSCREVSDIGHRIVFKTDRLSTPLIEIVTYPDMRTPQECAEVDELLGRLLRASGLVRRGIGTVRQDVNSSINGAPRIEIKGVPKTWYIPKMLDTEVKRQRKLLEIKEKLVSYGLVPNQKLDSSLREQERQVELEKIRNSNVADVTDMLLKSSSPQVKNAISRSDKIWAVKLPQFHEVLSIELQPGWQFADEFGARVRVIACIDKMPNLTFRSGKLLYPGDWEPIAQKLNVYPTDEIVLVWGPEADLKTAINEVILRADEAVRGIPEETRQHMQDGYRTDFERVLPGPDRMYPDTDSPPVRLTMERVDRIRADMAQRPWEREEKYAKLGLSKCVSDKLATHQRAKLFDKLVDLGISPKLAAELIVDWLTDLKRQRLIVSRLTDDTITKVMVEAKEKGLPKESIKNELKAFASDSNYIAKTQSMATDSVIKFIVEGVVDRSMQLKFSSKEAQIRWAKGQAMQSLYGRAHGSKVAKVIEEALS
ncbi:MAG: Glu-tRNA(Gln) amidotransferase subunit GatE [Caldisericia bacterium]|jgi:glutamyl-tRNA(Gln) amidotransferase subunit E|nr:Glu-tRNA(Gln) amidotransferase subunit GatE [Caldisericia bacterium]